MNPIHTTLPCYSKALPLAFLNSSQSPFFNSPQSLRPKPSSSISSNRRWRSYGAGVVTSATNSEIDMVRNKQGIYTPKQKKVVILWDLDNKPPRGPPYQAALALKQVAQHFGEVVDVSAYANRHAFVHLPHWVVEQRRERKQLGHFGAEGDSHAAGALHMRSLRPEVQVQFGFDEAL
ncbi:hypothetical protein M0R45_011943 [Rubus argutus]|uniref:Uncharacterized protein n=1 Tax=Rubus argutus TaxID=59490 RepID=A0AAW1YBQ7_RUBAR